MQEWRVNVGGEETSAVFDAAEENTGKVFICAHGAGGSMNDRGLVKLTAALRAKGFDIVRFNFLYKEKGSGRPDPMPKLEKCFTAVVDHARRELSPRTLVIGGRSMGGRAGSMIAATGFQCDGLLLFAYPLHPSGRPEKLRDAHLPDIKVPVLCFNGTRDPLCTPELMNKAVANLKNWNLRWIEGADHSFHVLKSSGKNDAQVIHEIADASWSWIESAPMAAPDRHISELLI